MKGNTCREFQAWLDGLPLSPLSPSPEWEQHMEECSECRRRYTQLSPVIAALMEAPAPQNEHEKLSSTKLEKISSSAESEYARILRKRSAVKVGLHTLMGLPFVAACNWLWIKLGSTLLTNIFSPDVARVYLILSLAAVTLITSLTLGSIPILWGRLREQPVKECIG
jgi:predicted anti-sigma-YlaC factor YlaD